MEGRRYTGSATDHMASYSIHGGSSHTKSRVGSETGESSSSSSRDGRDLIIVFCFLREGRGHLGSAEQCNMMRGCIKERKGFGQLCVAFKCFSWGKKIHRDPIRDGNGLGRNGQLTTRQSGRGEQQECSRGGKIVSRVSSLPGDVSLLSYNLLT